MKPNEYWRWRWQVPSQADPKKSYTVALSWDKARWGCTCPHYRFRKAACKHIAAVKAGFFGRNVVRGEAALNPKRGHFVPSRGHFVPNPAQRAALTRLVKHLLPAVRARIAGEALRAPVIQRSQVAARLIVDAGKQRLAELRGMVRANPESGPERLAALARQMALASGERLTVRGTVAKRVRRFQRLMARVEAEAGEIADLLSILVEGIEKGEIAVEPKWEALRAATRRVAPRTAHQLQYESMKGVENLTINRLPNGGADVEMGAVHLYLPETMAALLAALAADTGPSDDRLVAWKDYHAMPVAIGRPKMEMTKAVYRLRKLIQGAGGNPMWVQVNTVRALARFALVRGSPEAVRLNPGVLARLAAAPVERGHREVPVGTLAVARQAARTLRGRGLRPVIIAPRRGPVELVVPEKGVRVMYNPTLPFRMKYDLSRDRMLVENLHTGRVNEFVEPDDAKRWIASFERAEIRGVLDALVINAAHEPGIWQSIAIKGNPPIPLRFRFIEGRGLEVRDDRFGNSVVYATVGAVRALIAGFQPAEMRVLVNRTIQYAASHPGVWSALGVGERLPTVQQIQQMYRENPRRNPGTRRLVATDDMYDPNEPDEPPPNETMNEMLDRRNRFLSGVRRGHRVVVFMGGQSQAAIFDEAGPPVPGDRYWVRLVGTEARRLNPGALFLDPNMVPQHLRGGYTGRKFKAHVTDSVTIPNTAGLWEGGSRDTYDVVELATGRASAASDQTSSPWSAERRERVVTLRPGIVVREHTIVMGKDAGLTFYVHPSDAATMLPPPPSADLTDVDKQVLDIMASIISRGRESEREYRRISREQWEASLAKLKEMGLVSPRNSVTLAGDNVRSSWRYNPCGRLPRRPGVRANPPVIRDLRTPQQKAETRFLLVSTVPSVHHIIACPTEVIARNIARGRAAAIDRRYALHASPWTLHPWRGYRVDIEWYEGFGQRTAADVRARRGAIAGEAARRRPPAPFTTEARIPGGGTAADEARRRDYEAAITRDRQRVQAAREHIAAARAPARRRRATGASTQTVATRPILGGGGDFPPARVVAPQFAPCPDCGDPCGYKGSRGQFDYYRCPTHDDFTWPHGTRFNPRTRRNIDFPRPPDEAAGGRFPQVPLSAILTNAQSERVRDLINANDWPGLRAYLNSIGPALEAKGVLADYLYYVLLAKFGQRQNPGMALARRAR